MIYWFLMHWTWYSLNFWFLDFLLYFFFYLFIHSCCPDDLILVKSTRDHHFNITHNDSSILCANPETHKLRADERNFCSSGEWRVTGLEGGSEELIGQSIPYEIRNVNETIAVEYWGNNTLSKILFNEKLKFDIDSKFYCVGLKFACYFS